MPVGHLARNLTARRLRERKGWTQEELAAKAGVHAKTVSNIENGGRAKLSHIGYVAEALGVECGDLLEVPEFKTLDSSTEARCRITVKMRFEVVIDDLDHAAIFVDDFKKFLAAKKSVIVVDIDDGSLIATLEMHISDVITMLPHFCRGEYEQFQLVEIIFGITLAPYLDPISLEGLSYLSAELNRRGITTHEQEAEAKGNPADPAVDPARFLHWMFWRHSKTKGKRFAFPTVTVDCQPDGSVTIARLAKKPSPTVSW